MPTKNTFGIPVVFLSKVGDIEIHMVEQVSVQKESLVTKNPTETGLNVTDNIVNLPTVITMAGRFVDSPFGDLLAGVTTFADAEGGFEDGISVQRWNELVDLRKSKTLFSIIVQQGVFENMAFRSLRSPRSKGDGTSLRFEIEAVELFVSGVAPSEGGATPDIAHSVGVIAGLGPQASSVWVGGI